MGLIWSRQDPGGSHVGPMNFAIRELMVCVAFNHSNEAESPLSTYIDLISLISKIANKTVDYLKHDNVVITTIQIPTYQCHA